MAYDVFISYSHRDNIPTKPGEDGWIDSFHQALYSYLTVKLGREVSIWRDKQKLPGNTELDAAIFESLDESTILIPILSPNFVNSSYCPQELDYFCKNRKIEHVFPVLKLRTSKLPVQISESFIKYEFYKYDQKIQKEREIDPSFGDEDRNDMNLIISDIATDIAAFAETLIKPPAPPNPNEDDPVVVVDNSPLIYLAEPSPDLLEEYKNIKRDLQQRGCNFLPPDINPFKPSLAEEFIEEVREDIKKCSLAVHLIGASNNQFPRQSDKSYLHLQTEVAAERDSDPDFKRLIWFPGNVNGGEDAEHQKFIDQIKNTSSDKVEFLQNSIEDFKTSIQDALVKPEPAHQLPETDQASWIYILYDKCDLDAANHLESEINGKGYGVLSSKLHFNSANGVEAEKLHKQLLKQCNATLVYWRSAPFNWVINNILEVVSSSAELNGSGPRAKAVFFDEDLEESQKSSFLPPPNLMKIDGYPELPNFLSHLEV